MYRGTIQTMPIDDDDTPGFIAEGGGPRAGMEFPFAKVDVLNGPATVGSAVTFTTTPTGDAGRPRATNIVVVGG